MSENLNLPPDIFNNYSIFLRHLEISTNTFKNYLSDTRNFLEWNADSPLDFSRLTEYRNFLSSNNPTKTANRRLSSLRKFCQYLHQSGLSASDLSTSLLNLTVTPPSLPNPLDSYLKSFSTYLKDKGASESTVKNYLSDIRHFWQFLNSGPRPEHADLISLYHQHLLATVESSATVNRRLSALKKFLELFPPETFISAAPAPVGPLLSEVENSAPTLTVAPAIPILSPTPSQNLPDPAPAPFDPNPLTNTSSYASHPLLKNYPPPAVSSLSSPPLRRPKKGLSLKGVFINLLACSVGITIGLLITKLIFQTNLLIDPVSTL